MQSALSKSTEEQTLGFGHILYKASLTLVLSWAKWLWSRSNDVTWGVSDLWVWCQYQASFCLLLWLTQPGCYMTAACGSHTDLMLDPEWSQTLVKQNASRAAFCSLSVERAWGPAVLRLTDSRWIRLQLFFLIFGLCLKRTIECHSKVELADLEIGCQAVNPGIIFLLLLIRRFLVVALFLSANMTENTSGDLFISHL